MLKGLDPLIDAELLFVLAAMGHGDELAVVDANFPAVSFSRRLVRLSGADVNEAMRAVLSVLPLDTVVDEPVVAMELACARGEMRPVHLEVHAVCEEIEGRPITMGSLSREAFYGRARQAFAVLATSEQRPYGCFLLTKGVLGA